MDLPESRLDILYNEANRQRWLSASVVRTANYAKNFDREFQKAIKVHGNYTDGFHDDELQRLKQKLGTQNG